MASLADKLAALEAKFSTLETKYNDLYQKSIGTSATANGEATLTSPITPPTPAEESATADKETTTEDKSQERKSRAKIVINVQDKKTGERKDQPPSDSNLGKDVDSAYAFTLRKIINEDDEKNDGELDITDEGLWDLLKSLLGHYPYHIFRGAPQTLYSPYEPFVLYWAELEAATKQEPTDDKDKQARDDLKELLEKISTSSGDSQLDKYFKARETNISQASVTFETLWTIFRPGTLLYGKPFQGEEQVLITQDSLIAWPNLYPGMPREHRFWELLCYAYDWDGKNFRRRSLKVRFEYFDGNKPITSLPYYPLDLHTDKDNVKTKLIARGRKFQEYCRAPQGSRMFEYNGDAIFVKKGFSGVQGDDDRDDDDDDSPRGPMFDPRRGIFFPPLPGSRSLANKPPTKSTTVESRVMIDFESYFKYGPGLPFIGKLKPNSENPECDCMDCQSNEPLRIGFRTRFDMTGSDPKKWEDEQFLLCPPRLLGYILREKQWAQLDVNLLETIPKKDPNDSWSTRLKLADGDRTKDMILDLVKGHSTSESAEEGALEVDDIIERKGKGLVMLLYGPPGVGKTSTAETVAIAARKPLFAVSVADVGMKAKHVERNLEKIFSLATSWQAILLIDEADVFLESRGKGLSSDTERNALVSVFLRVLEYYKGILMLTTNQIAQFDVAVQSRIHVAIKYVTLNEKQTMAIFKGFLDPLAERGMVKDMEEITEWLQEDVVKMGLDGRQVRNIVTSALGLARAQRKDALEKRHIKMILSNVKDFKDEFGKQTERYKVEQQGMIR